MQNHFLNNISSDLKAEWMRHLKLHEIQKGTRLELNKSRGFLYFPATCVTVLRYRYGMTPFFTRGIFGSRSLIGMSSWLNAAGIIFEADVVQGGYIYTLPINILSDTLDDQKNELILWSLKYSVRVLTVISACTQNHTTEKQLARTLLRAFRESPTTNSTGITQSDFSEIIGVRRETVTSQLSRWSKEGIIGTSRLSIKLKDEEALKKKVCECFWTEEDIKIQASKEWKNICSMRN